MGLAMEFDWMETPPPTPRKKIALETRSDEIFARAGLFARLGYDQGDAVARLRANTAWEHDRIGTARVSKKIESIVAEAFKMAGRGGKRKVRGKR